MQANKEAPSAALSDAQWLDEVVLQNYSRIKKTAYRTAKAYNIPDPEHWSEDIAQEVFLRLTERMEPDALHEHKNIAGWLAVTLRNVIGTQWQKRANREIAVAEVWALRREPSCEMTENELFPPGLTNAERDILYRCDYLGYSTDETAATLGITPSACRMRLSRAERKYRHLRAKIEHSTKTADFRPNDEVMLENGGAKHV